MEWSDWLAISAVVVALVSAGYAYREARAAEQALAATQPRLRAETDSDDLPQGKDPVRVRLIVQNATTRKLRNVKLQLHGPSVDIRYVAFVPVDDLEQRTHKQTVKTLDVATPAVLQLIVAHDVQTLTVIARGWQWRLFGPYRWDERLNVEMPITPMIGWG